MRQRKRPIPSRARRGLGFSLVELVVVIAVVGVLSGVVSLSVGSIDADSRLSVAAARALSDLRYAQETAMSERREIYFNVNAGTETYWATYKVGGAAVPSPGDKTKPLRVVLNQKDAKGVVITSSAFGTGTVFFNIDGVPRIGANPIGASMSVMLLNGKQNLVLFQSGYSVINPVAGACGGCGC